MKRKTSSSKIAVWKKAFSGGSAKASKKDGQKTEGQSLTLIKKVPVTFQIIKQEHPVDFERMLFVIRACDKSSSNPFKTVLHIEQTRTGSRLVATDGTRLHVAEITRKIKSGDYKPHVTKDTIRLGKPLTGIKFPDWAKAIPKNIEKTGVVNLEKTNKGNPVDKAAEMSLAVNTLSAKTGLVMNMMHIADLPKTSWTVYKEPGYGKVLVMQQGEEDHALAVFIPVGKAA